MHTVFSYLPIIGRLLIGFYFVFFGIWNIYHWKPTIDIMLEDQIPSPILCMSIGVSCQIILGVMLMCNIYVKITAVLLILSTVFSTLMFHPFWRFKGERKKYHMNKLMDNVTVTLGGLILLINIMTPLNSMGDMLN